MTFDFDKESVDLLKRSIKLQLWHDATDRASWLSVEQPTPGIIKKIEQYEEEMGKLQTLLNRLC